MEHKSEKSPGEASRDGLEMSNEHHHSHEKHMENNAGGAAHKHVSPPNAPSPAEEHRGGPLPNEKK